MVNFFAKKEPSADAPRKAPSFRTYVDPTHEFESRAFSRELWFVRHEVTLYKIFFGLMVSLATIFWGYSLWQLGDYLIFGIVNDQKLATESVRFINYTSRHAKYAPNNLNFIDTFFLPGGRNRTDIVADVENPNSTWYAEFNYRFGTDTIGGAESFGFVLPGVRTLLASLGNADATAGPDITISNLKWQRISNHSIPDLAVWLRSHLDFAVTDFNFISAGSGAEVAAGATINFTLTNRTPYGYRAPEFLVGLYHNGGLVGVLPLKLDSFASLEIKKIDLRSFAPGLVVDSVELFPKINLFSSESYLKPPV